MVDDEVLCIQCDLRPIWRPYSVYVCQECYEHIMEARADCPCPCHATNPTPSMCCTERHLLPCPSLHNDGREAGHWPTAHSDGSGCAS